MLPSTLCDSVHVGNTAPTMSTGLRLSPRAKQTQWKLFEYVMGVKLLDTPPQISNRVVYWNDSSRNVKQSLHRSRGRQVEHPAGTVSRYRHFQADGVLFHA